MTVNVSRREQNKLDKQEAIANAARSVLRDKGYGNFTVEDVAERAGVSRRTFFNYFSSVDAAISEPVGVFLEGVLDSFKARPSDEPILVSALAALEERAVPTYLKPLAEVYELSECSQGLLRGQVEVWQQTEQRLQEVAAERTNNAAPEFYVTALVSAILGVGQSAMDYWFATQRGEINAQSLEELRRILIQGFIYLQDGFNSVPHQH